MLPLIHHYYHHHHHQHLITITVILPLNENYAPTLFYMFVLCPKQNKLLGLASIHYDNGIVQVTNKLRRVCARINSGQIHKICHLSFLKRSSPEDCQWGPNNSSYVEKEFWLWWVARYPHPRTKKGIGELLIWGVQNSIGRISKGRYKQSPHLW